MKPERKTTLKSGDGADVSIGSTVYTAELEELVVEDIERWGIEGALYIEAEDPFVIDASAVYVSKRTAAERGVIEAREMLAEAEARLAALESTN